MTTALHDAGTINEHYYHPSPDVDGCVKCGRNGRALVVTPPPDDAEGAAERAALAEEFAVLLKQVTGDGGKKRAAGLKPPWWRDLSHEAAIFSHLNKWKHGERADKDSGAHPLVHLAWRALAIAYQETYGQVDPRNRRRD